jgi:predicted ATPase/DNA-binding CsgD family transcriptional regulator
VQETGDRPAEVALPDYLNDRRVLLVLDNYEHVIAAAPLVSRLLEQSPHLVVLVTSRAPLRLRWEHVFPVPPLALPDPRRPLPPGDAAPALALFAERARAARPDFRLTEANAAAVVDLCARLDGLPLAIELAAARVALLTPQELRTHLDHHHLHALAGGPRDVHARQQTLWRTVDWSYTLLNPNGQRLFRQLAVFAGGWTLAAAGAVAGDTVPAAGRAVDWVSGDAPHVPDDVPDETTVIFDALASLVEQSLVRRHDGDDGESRYSLLETIRSYGQAQLHESGEAGVVADRHAAYFLTLAEEAAPALRGPEQLRWLDRLAAEHDNLRAALRWLTTRAGENPRDPLPPTAASRGAAAGHPPGVEALRLATALHWFWLVRGHLTEGRRWLREALAGDRGGNNQGAGAAARGSADGTALAVGAARWVEARTAALCAAGPLAVFQGDYAAAVAALEEALSLGQQAGDARCTGHALTWLGVAATDQGDRGSGRGLLEAGVAHLRRTDDAWALAFALLALSRTALQTGDDAGAQPLCAESLTRIRETGDAWGISASLAQLGNLALRRGDHAAARVHYEEGLVLRRRLGDAFLIAQASSALAEVARECGDFPRAEALCAECLALFRQLGSRRDVALVLDDLAGLAALQGHAARAARLFGTAGALLAATGAVLEPADRARSARDEAMARAALGGDTFEAEWERGRLMTLEQVLVDIGGAAPAPPPPLVGDAEGAGADMTRVAGRGRSEDAARDAGGRPADWPPGAGARGAHERLTAREIEVLRLVTTGLTNAQVAQRLVISPVTVNAHLRVIYGKLGVPSRTAATRYAVEHGLT